MHYQPTLTNIFANLPAFSWPISPSFTHGHPQGPPQGAPPGSIAAVARFQAEGAQPGAADAGGAGGELKHLAA